MRAVVKAILLQAGMDVVGEAADGEEAVALCESLHPDVVVLDVSMPRMNGIVAARRLARSCPGTSVVFLTLWVDEHLVTQASSMRASCVLKTRAATALVPAIRAAKQDLGEEVHR